MKVLHVINSLATGGAEKLILETLPKYNELGIKADVLLLNGTSHPFLEELRALNCCEIFTLGNSSPYQLQFVLKLIAYFKKYDLIHAHLFPATYFSALAKKLSFSKTPLVFTEHSTSNRRFRSKKFKKVNSLIYSFFDKVICITEEVKNEVIAKTDLPENKLVIINNGVDLLKISNAQALNRTAIHSCLQNDDFLLLQVSSFREQKDQQTIIRALKFLPERVKLILVGEGKRSEAAVVLVKQLDLEQRVLFLGNRSDVPRLLKTADVNILSSVYEGLSLSSIEGLASGKPFIASDVAGLSEVVGDAGILFPKGDERILAEEILKLIKDKEHYREIALKCKKRAEKYDIGLMVEQHLRLYAELVS